MTSQQQASGFDSLTPRFVALTLSDEQIIPHYSGQPWNRSGRDQAGIDGVGDLDQPRDSRGVELPVEPRARANTPVQYTAQGTGIMLPSEYMTPSAQTSNFVSWTHSPSPSGVPEGQGFLTSTGSPSSWNNRVEHPQSEAVTSWMRLQQHQQSSSLNPPMTTSFAGHYPGNSQSFGVNAQQSSSHLGVASNHESRPSDSSLFGMRNTSMSPQLCRTEQRLLDDCILPDSDEIHEDDRELSYLLDHMVSISAAENHGGRYWCSYIS